MYTTRSTPDATIRQYVRNAVGQIESGVSNCETDLRELISEFAFLTESGLPEVVAVARVDVARSAVKLGQLMARLQALLDKLKEAAGEKAMKVAETPIAINL